MTSQTDKALSRTMTAIVASAPDSPDLPVAHPKRVTHLRRNPAAVVAFAFAVVAVVGIGLTMSLPITSTSTSEGASRTASEATTYARLAEDLRGSPIPDAETMLIAGGESGIVPGSGYVIESRAVENYDAIVGVVLYQYQELGDAAVYSCLSDYAKVGDFYLEGSGACTPDISQLASVAAANLAVAQLCGPVPIDPSLPDSQPQLESDWTIASVWGVPRGVDTVRFTLDDGSVVPVEVSDSGYAHVMMAGLPVISSIDFDGMTSTHLRLATSLLPTTLTNCTYAPQR